MSTSELKLFRTAIMQAWNAVVITDADRANGYPVQIANPAFCNMTGYTLEELRGRSLKMLQGPDTDPAVVDRLRRCLQQEIYFEGSTTNYRKDGSPYFVRWSISPVYDEDRQLSHFVSVQQDISDYVRAERQNRLFARALDASNDPILLMDRQFRTLFANKAFSDATGYAIEELVGNTPAMLRSDQNQPEFYQDLITTLASGQPFRGTFINQRRDGTTYYAEQSISPIVDDNGQTSHYVSVSKDISELILREKFLQRVASTDQLTKLHNRLHGEELLKLAHRAAGASGSPLSLILCDIDFFKQVNDRFGHLVGDRVLATTADVLRRNVRSGDAVIRWGGEEFLIVLENCGLVPALALAERIRAGVERQSDPDVHKVTASLGIATQSPGESIEALFERADAALYQAKRAGRNRVMTAAESRGVAEAGPQA